jgi:hypothetical protein
MNKNVGVIFIILYFVALLKPVSPYLEYTINKDFIAKVLCINKDKPELKCNGKCHLTKQLKKASDTNEKKRGLISIKDYPIGFVNISKFKIYCRNHIKLKSSYLSFYSFIYNKKILRPPAC